MKYLANITKNISKAHIWDDGDTYCKMYSTGGLRKKKQTVIDHPHGKEICLMCANVWNQFNPDKKIEQDTEVSKG
jgi:hypothetical protein